MTSQPSPRAYLIVATYNLAKYNAMNAKGKYLEARKVALALFPYDWNTPPKKTPVSELASQGVVMASAFDSDLTDRLPGDYSARKPDEMRLLIEGAFAIGPLSTPVGWAAVVRQESFAAYIDRMSGGGATTAFWDMYDTAIIPLAEGWTANDVRRLTPALRNDTTTDDIYLFMTPTNWKS